MLSKDIVKRRLEGCDFSSDEDKNEIRESIDFNKFSVEELLTYVGGVQAIHH